MNCVKLTLIYMEKFLFFKISFIEELRKEQNLDMFIIATLGLNWQKMALQKMVCILAVIWIGPL